MISVEDMQKVEDEIRRYFRYTSEIDRLRNRLRLLEAKKAEIENDISNSNVSLNVSMPGSGYDGDSIRGSGPTTSQQEKALESAFARLERQLERVKDEIRDVNVDIRDNELAICDMTFIFDKLDETARGFVNLHYGRRIGYAKIVDQLHLSNTSLSRLRIRVLTDIAGYLFFMEQKRDESGTKAEQKQ